MAQDFAGLAAAWLAELRWGERLLRAERAGTELLRGPGRTGAALGRADLSRLLYAALLNGRNGGGRIAGAAPRQIGGGRKAAAGFAGGRSGGSANDIAQRTVREPKAVGSVIKSGGSANEVRQEVDLRPKLPKQELPALVSGVGRKSFAEIFAALAGKSAAETMGEVETAKTLEAAGTAGTAESEREPAKAVASETGRGLPNGLAAEKLLDEELTSALLPERTEAAKPAGPTAAEMAVLLGCGGEILAAEPKFDAAAGTGIDAGGSEGKEVAGVWPERPGNERSWSRPESGGGNAPQTPALAEEADRSSFDLEELTEKVAERLYDGLEAALCSKSFVGI